MNMSDFISCTDRFQQVYLYSAVGFGLSILPVPPIAWKIWKQYRATQATTQLWLFRAITCFAVFFLAASASDTVAHVICKMPHFYETVYQRTLSAACILLLLSFCMLSHVIIERLLLLQLTTQRSRTMLTLHTVNIALRLSSILAVAYTGCFAGHAVYRLVLLIALSLNFLYSIALDLVVNFVVALRVLRGSVAIVRVLEGHDNRDAKRLAASLFRAMTLSVVFETLGAAAFALEDSLPPPTGLLYGPALLVHLYAVTYYQDGLRGIYLTSKGEGGAPCAPPPSAATKSARIAANNSTPDTPTPDPRRE